MPKITRQKLCPKKSDKEPRPWNRNAFPPAHMKMRDVHKMRLENGYYLDKKLLTEIFYPQSAVDPSNPAQGHQNEGIVSFNPVPDYRQAALASNPPATRYQQTALVSNPPATLYQQAALASCPPTTAGYQNAGLAAYPHASGYNSAEMASYPPAPIYQQASTSYAPASLYQNAGMSSCSPALPTISGARTSRLPVSDGYQSLPPFPEIMSGKSSLSLGLANNIGFGRNILIDNMMTGSGMSRPLSVNNQKKLTASPGGGDHHDLAGLPGFVLPGMCLVEPHQIVVPSIHPRGEMPQKETHTIWGSSNYLRNSLPQQDYYGGGTFGKWMCPEIPEQKSQSTTQYSSIPVTVSSILPGHAMPQKEFKALGDFDIFPRTLPQQKSQNLGLSDIQRRREVPQQESQRVGSPETLKRRLPLLRESLIPKVSAKRAHHSLPQQVKSHHSAVPGKKTRITLSQKECRHLGVSDSLTLKAAQQQESLQSPASSKSQEILPLDELPEKESPHIEFADSPLENKLPEQVSLDTTVKLPEQEALDTEFADSQLDTNLLEQESLDTDVKLPEQKSLDTTVKLPEQEALDTEFADSQLDTNLLEQESLDIDNNLLEQESLEIDNNLLEQDSLDIDTNLLEQESLDIDNNLLEQESLDIDNNLLEQDSLDIDNNLLEQESLDIDNNLLEEESQNTVSDADLAWLENTFGLMWPDGLLGGKELKAMLGMVALADELTAFPNPS